jgi:hypothetical protein
VVYCAAIAQSPVLRMAVLASSLWGRQTLVAGPIGTVLPSFDGVRLHCVCVPRGYLLCTSDASLFWCLCAL